MIVTVLRNAGNPDAPQGATVDASGWVNLDLMLQMGYVRPASAAEHTAYLLAALSTPATEPEPEPDSAVQTESTDPELSGEPAATEPEPIVQTELTDPEPSSEPEPPTAEPTKPTVRKSR